MHSNKCNKKNSFLFISPGGPVWVIYKKKKYLHVENSDF